MCWSRHLLSVHEVEPVRLSIAVRCVWQQFGRARPILRDDANGHFDRALACVRGTDRQTDRHMAIV